LCFGGIHFECDQVEIKIPGLISVRLLDPFFLRQPHYFYSSFFERSKKNMLGKTISHYRILEKLGEGGMGVIFKAEDTKLKRFVALKFLPPALTSDKEARERFIYEAQAASGLDHPNICTIYEIDETAEGQMFIAMAYYEGETLQKKVASNQAAPAGLAVNSAVDIAIQIATGLAKAHQHGIVHRDIKPSNVIVTNEGVIKIVDFGLAKLSGVTRLTKAGTTMGTVAYMSPEQTWGEDVDHRSDLWSLGVVLYEMLTGKLPFRGEYEQAVIYSILHDEPKPIAELRAGVPMELERIVGKALAKNPDGRYQRMDELLDDLANLHQGNKPEKIKTHPPKTTRLRVKRQWLYAGMAFLLLLLIVAISLKLLRRTETKAGPASIAVLPFVNMSADAEKEYFSDGMTEELINALAKLKELNVVARTSVFQYKGKAYDIRKIGEQLNVSTVLEGSVRQAGEKMRITTQLINVADGYHLWSETFDESDTQDVFGIQDAIARAIVDKLEIALVSNPEGKLVIPPTGNLEAYDLYLKGRFFWNKRSSEGLQQGLQYFAQAIEKDPAYALAYAGLADSYVLLGQFAFLPPQEAFPKASAVAQKALEINDQLAEAHNSLAFAKELYEWDWPTAEREFKRALALNPNYATAYQWYAEYLAAMNRFNEALVAIERARELDPFSLIINSVEAYIFLLNSLPELSIERYRQVIEREPNFPAYAFLARAFLQKGRYDEAIAEIEKEIKFFGRKPVTMALLAYAYAANGKREEALKLRDELEQQSQHTYVEPCQMAILYSGLGDNDQAFRWLGQAYKDHSGALVFAKVDPFFNSLRSDSRFTELLKKMGLEK
jgi:serine/threonine-protein kinase